jgi:hypothetical protein
VWKAFTGGKNIDTPKLKLYQFLTEGIGMRRKLALLVELEWAEGGLTSSELVSRFAKNVALPFIASHHPRAQWGNLDLGAEQIEDDMHKVLRVLRYGGRRPADIPAKRLELLKTNLTASSF